MLLSLNAVSVNNTNTSKIVRKPFIEKIPPGVVQCLTCANHIHGGTSCCVWQPRCTTGVSSVTCEHSVSTDYGVTSCIVRRICHSLSFLSSLSLTSPLCRWLQFVCKKTDEGSSFLAVDKHAAVSRNRPSYDHNKVLLRLCIKGTTKTILRIYKLPWHANNIWWHMAHITIKTTFRSSLSDTNRKIHWAPADSILAE